MMFKVLCAALLSTSLFAAEPAPVVVPAPVVQLAGYNFAGVSLGFAKPVGSNMGFVPLRFAYGVEFNHALTNEISVGAFVSRNSGEAFKNSSVDFNLTNIGVEATYSPIYDALLSLRAGLGIMEYSSTFNGTTFRTSPDSNPFFVAPGIGEVFVITDNIQFIPTLRYSFYLETSDTPSFQVFDVLASLRYRF